MGASSEVERDLNPVLGGREGDRTSRRGVTMRNSGSYTLRIARPCGKSWQLSIPQGAVVFLAGLCVVGIATLTVMVKSYARMLTKVSDYNQLRASREAINAKYHLLQKVVNHTNVKLDSLESLASQVAEAYGFGRKMRSRPQFLVQAGSAAEDPIGESSYNAALNAFSLIEQASLDRPQNSMLLGLLSNPSINPVSIPSIWPVRGEVTAGFGERTDPFSGEDAFHPGIDIAAPYGTAVEASADGVVVQAGPGEPGFGNEIVIDHGSGIETLYCHLSKIEVVEGQHVRQGQLIGAVGMSGRTTGPHLHYEVLVDQTPVNPESFLRG
jgi:murein DD-endopeptidase MepM/ murein hydrolase activator NlpD